MIKYDRPNRESRQYLCRCGDCGWSNDQQMLGLAGRRKAFKLARSHSKESGHHAVVDECIYHGFYKE